MKKNQFIIMIIGLIGFALGILIYARSNNRYEEEICCIKKNYSMINENDVFTISLFINRSIHQITDENTTFYLCDKDETIRLNLTLDDIYIKSEEKYQKMYFYQYVLIFKNLNQNDDVFFFFSYLLVNMPSLKYKIAIGSFSSVTINGYIPFNSLYGVFNTINGCKTLVGIVIGLDRYNYLVDEFIIGSKSYIDTENIIPLKDDISNDINITDLIPHYKYFGKNKRKSYFIASDKLFLPIRYEQLQLNDNPALIFKTKDDVLAIDNFNYLNHNLSLNKYQDLINKGKII